MPAIAAAIGPRIAIGWHRRCVSSSRHANADLAEIWPYFRRRDLHQLSAVDATSFVLMSHARIRTAFAFDHHFSSAGFRLAA